MRAIIILLAAAIPFLWATSASAKSCSTFAIITGFDASGSSVTIEKQKSSEREFFPRPDGAPNTQKIPRKCKSKILKAESFPVKATGGRLSITQIRSNFEGKMLNNTEDSSWLGAELQKLVDGKTLVAAVLRPPPGAKEPYGVTTIYLPITEEEKAEITRLENQASDE